MRWKRSLWRHHRSQGSWITRSVNVSSIQHKDKPTWTCRAPCCRKSTQKQWASPAGLECKNCRRSRCSCNLEEPCPSGRCCCRGKRRRCLRGRMSKNHFARGLLTCACDRSEQAQSRHGANGQRQSKHLSWQNNESSNAALNGSR
jgi:hypothetical protein